MPVTPILRLVPLAGRLGKALREERNWLAPWLMSAAGLVLILLGLRRILALTY
jgi:thiol:disulfide interchange protein DsbD